MSALSSSVLAARFKRAGGHGRYTKLFGDLQEDARKTILNEVSLDGDEEPVVSHFRNNEHWCLLTTHRVVWRASGNTVELANDAIAEITWDRQATINRNLRDKREFRDLRLVDKTGKAHVIELEPGKPFFGMWNTINY